MRCNMLGSFFPVLSAMLLAACGSTQEAKHTPVASRADSSAVTPTAPQHPTVMAIQRCIARALQQSGALKQTILIDHFDSQATESKYLPGLPQPLYNTFAAAVVSELGYQPIVIGTDIKLSGRTNSYMTQLSPDLVISGSIVGFDALTSKWRSAIDGGIGFGKGVGMASINGGKEDMLALGQVTATVTISVTKLVSAPGLKKNERLTVFPVTSTASATAEFRMSQSNHQANASVVIGLGGGYAKERVSVVDVQSAALFAYRMAIALALAQQHKLNTPVCTNT